MSAWGAVKGRLRASLRTDCLPTFGVPAVNGGRPALSRRVLCQHRCRSAPNEHNVALSEMGLHGPQRLTAHYVGTAHPWALRGYLGPGARLAAGLSFSEQCGAPGSPAHPLLSAPEPKPAAAVAAVRGGSGAKIRLKPLSVSPSRSTALKAGQQAGAIYGPRPTLLHWLRPARSRRLLARSRTRHLRPVRPRERGLPAEKLHLRASPARTRPTRVSGADKLHRRHGFPIKPGSGRQSGAKPGADVGEKMR